MNKTVAVIFSLLIASAPVLGSEKTAQQLEKTIKNVRIMEGILSTATETKSGDSRARIESLYLANQGVVFWVDPRTRHFKHGIEFNFNAIGPFIDEVMETVEEELESTLEWQMDGDDSFDFSHLEHPTPPEFELISPGREHSEELREWVNQYKTYADEMRQAFAEQRQLAEEMRRYHRELRKSARDSEAEQKARASLDKTRQSYQQLKKNIDKKMAEAKAKREALSRRQFQALLHDLVSTLCDYGSAMRTLDKNEHITFVVEDAGEGRREDMVYVFKKADIDQCTLNDQAAAEVLAKATRYSI